MRFALVDHDTNYFTKPEQLENVYEKIWDKIPISLSVVPFHACTKSGAIPREYWQGDRIFPIGENKKLVEFLKRKIKENKVSILMHGYSHKNYENGHEFEVGDRLYEKVKEGKKYLEETFGVEIKTFAPPHNSLSKEGMKAVTANRLNILGSFSFRPSQRPFEMRNIFYFSKRQYFRWKEKKGKNVPYPRAMRFKNHWVLNCYSLTPSTRLEELMQGLELVVKYNGDFCLATHYWEIKKGKTEEIFRIFHNYLCRFMNLKYIGVNNFFILEA